MRSPPARVDARGTVDGHSPICRVIDETIGLLLRARPPTRAVARRLVDVPVYTAAEYAERLHDFRVRLEAITAYCERVGAMVVLVIPPGNDADFEPNRSFLPPETPRAERDAFARDFEAARRLEAADPAGAAAAYRALLDRQPGFAETHYRLARLAGSGRPSRRGGPPLRRGPRLRRPAVALPLGFPGRLPRGGGAAPPGDPDRRPGGAPRPQPRAAGRATPSSPTPSTRRSSATPDWPRRSSGACTLAGPSAGARPPAPEPALTAADCARHFGMEPGEVADRVRLLRLVLLAHDRWSGSTRRDVRPSSTSTTRRAGRIQAGTAPGGRGRAGNRDPSRRPRRAWP